MTRTLRIATWNINSLRLRLPLLSHLIAALDPGGATALGALGYVSAGLELAQQIARHELPVPRRVIVGVGSTCTSAGLLVGLALAGHLGRGPATTTTPTAVLRGLHAPRCRAGVRGGRH